MTQAVARVGDNANIPECSHSCNSCPHNCTGPHIQGSPDVDVNGKACVRVGDLGQHSSCCNENKHTAKVGSGTVFVNGKAIHRKDDETKHCGGKGTSIVGSDDVFAGG